MRKAIKIYYSQEVDVDILKASLSLSWPHFRVAINQKREREAEHEI